MLPSLLSHSKSSSSRPVYRWAGTTGEYLKRALTYRVWQQPHVFLWQIFFLKGARWHLESYRVKRVIQGLIKFPYDDSFFTQDVGSSDSRLKSSQAPLWNTFICQTPVKHLYLKAGACVYVIPFLVWEQHIKWMRWMCLNVNILYINYFPLFFCLYWQKTVHINCNGPKWRGHVVSPIYQKILSISSHCISCKETTPSIHQNTHTHKNRTSRCLEDISGCSLSLDKCRQYYSQSALQNCHSEPLNSHHWSDCLPHMLGTLGQKKKRFLIPPNLDCCHSKGGLKVLIPTLNEVPLRHLAYVSLNARKGGKHSRNSDVINIYISHL